MLTDEIGQILQSHNWTLVTAESCTAGGIAFAITQIPGSSAWFERGFVTYSNLSKKDLLGVKHNTLLQYGAVSKETAQEMAEGALLNTPAHISIAVTGIAGPDGGSLEKPVGTVWFAIASRNQPTHSFHHLFKGDRQSIRDQAITAGLQDLLSFLHDMSA